MRERSLHSPDAWRLSNYQFGKASACTSAQQSSNFYNTALSRAGFADSRVYDVLAYNTLNNYLSQFWMHAIKWVTACRDEKWWWNDFAIFLFTSSRDSISLGNAFTSERRRRNRARTNEAVDYQDRAMPFHARCRTSIKKSPLRENLWHYTRKISSDTRNQVLKFRRKIKFRKWKKPIIDQNRSWCLIILYGFFL